MQRFPELSLMVVDDDERLLDALETALAPAVGGLRCCRDVSTVRRLIGVAVPDVLVLDVALPDGDAFDVLDLIERRDASPQVIVISGTATPPQSFELAQRGVRGYLCKPFTIAELCQAIERALSEPPDLRGTLRCLVGQRPLREVEQEVRSTMVKEALGRSEGKRKAAARLLSISRQLLQHILRGWG